MKELQRISVLAIILLIEFSWLVRTLPTDIDDVTIQAEENSEDALERRDSNSTNVATNPPTFSNNEANDTITADLEAAGSEQKVQTIDGPVDTMETSDNTAAASSIDPTFYGGGVLPPNAFQQYMSHFGAPYPFAAAPYPAPVYPGFIPPPPPIYPSPYVVETGYDGYLVPSKTIPTTTTTDTSATTAATITSMMINPLIVIGNILSAILMSNIFPVLASIASAVGMIFFSGAIINLICNHTPICDVSNKAVTYFRRRDTAANMGRIIAEEMTPERIRRAAEFVQSAISKYHELQELMKDKTKVDGSVTGKVRE